MSYLCDHTSSVSSCGFEGRAPCSRWCRCRIDLVAAPHGHMWQSSGSTQTMGTSHLHFLHLEKSAFKYFLHRRIFGRNVWFQMPLTKTNKAAFSIHKGWTDAGDWGTQHLLTHHLSILECGKFKLCENRSCYSIQMFWFMPEEWNAVRNKPFYSLNAFLTRTNDIF